MTTIARIASSRGDFSAIALSFRVTPSGLERVGGRRNSTIIAQCRFSPSTFSRALQKRTAMVGRKRESSTRFGSSLRATERQSRSNTVHTRVAAAASAFSTDAKKRTADEGSSASWSERSMSVALAVGAIASFATGALFVGDKSRAASSPLRPTDVLDGKPWKSRLPTNRVIPAGPSRFPDVYDASVGATQGPRSYMEDNYLLRDGGRFAAVFDGHGGAGVSGFLREHLYKSFIMYVNQEEAEHSWDPTPSLQSRVNALRSAFREVEREVVKMNALKDQGSTAVAVVLHEDEDGERTLVSANIGDSRAVLSRAGIAVPLTRDHKPGDPTEKQRISSMGGHVEYDEFGDIYRVRGLGVSRSIGDREAKPIVYSEPEIMQLRVVNSMDEFIILASDGLWDVFTNEEAVRYVHKKMLDAVGSTDAEKRRGLSNIVAREAVRRGSSDNVCVAIVWLK